MFVHVRFLTLSPLNTTTDKVVHTSCTLSLNFITDHFLLSIAANSSCNSPRPMLQDSPVGHLWYHPPAVAATPALRTHSKPQKAQKQWLSIARAAAHDSEKLVSKHSVISRTQVLPFAVPATPFRLPNFQPQHRKWWCIYQNLAARTNMALC